MSLDANVDTVGLLKDSKKAKAKESKEDGSWPMARDGAVVQGKLEKIRKMLIMSVDKKPRLRFEFASFKFGLRERCL